MSKANRTSQDPATLKGEVLAAIQETLSRLQASAKVGETRHDERTVSVSVTPGNEDAAELVVGIDEKIGWLYLHLGVATPVEIGPKGHAISHENQLEEFRLMFAAVTQGGLEETVWYRGEKVARAKSKLRLGSRSITIRTHDLPALLTFGRSRKEVGRYRSYS